MALVDCRECEKEVSDQAKTCPHCGIAKPARATKKKMTRGQKIALGACTVIAILVLIGVTEEVDEEAASNIDQAETASSEGEEIAAIEQPEVSPRPRPEAAAAEVAAANAEAEECASDLQCWGEKHMIRASFPCESLVESMANYTMEWTDGWMEPKFSHYRWRDIPNRGLTYIGNKARFQNGFGAWKNVRYECDYDPHTETALDVRVIE